jgi:hypothetical protein
MRINEYCTKERDEMQNDYTKFRITKEKSEIQMEKCTKQSYNKYINKGK